MLQIDSLTFDAWGRRVFDDATFVGYLGIAVSDVGPGWCESRLKVEPRHLTPEHQREGVLRRHMKTRSDHIRDTDFFSILAEEWPAVRARLIARIGNGAFDLDQTAVR